VIAVRVARRFVTVGGALVALVLWQVARAPADELETAGGEVLTGVVQGVDDGKLAFQVGQKAGAAAEVRSFSLTDLARVSFEPTLSRPKIPSKAKGDSKSIRVMSYVPLVDNDQAGTGRSLSGTIKLRAGTHRIVIPYWHADGRSLLRLQYSFHQGSRQRGLRIVPPSILFHADAQAVETPSPGVDKEGYRLPETISAVSPNLTYTLHRLTDGRRFKTMGDLLTARATSNSGTIDRITARPFPDDEENLAMLLVGYLRVPDDGEYTFLLSSDGGSQLYFGETPSGLRLIDSSQASVPWTLTLADGGKLAGTLREWKDGKVGFAVHAGRSRPTLAIPVERVAEIWSNKPLGKDDKIDRSNLSTREDAIYARSSTGGRIQRVPGRVRGIEGDSLVVQFGGTNRNLALARVVGMVLAANRETPTDHGFYQVVETFGGQKIPGELKSLDAGGATFQTRWGDQLLFDVDELTGLVIRNGKAISLTDLAPAHVDQIPYFDRVVPYRVNESLSGGPIVLRDGKCGRGISVHAKTVLQYTLGGHFQRFRSRVGFQLPEGALGDAAVRVLGDDKPLFERPSLRGDASVEPIDVDVTGVGTLTLAVDFGPREDVGDRVVWCDPTLIRANVGPTGSAPVK
jgi:hypothetical protein